MCLRPSIIEHTGYTVRDGTASGRLLFKSCLGPSRESMLPATDVSNLAMIAASGRHAPKSFRGQRCTPGSGGCGSRRAFR
jgi:hypothetical protein